MNKEKNVTIYENTETKKYESDLKYWSNAAGELHHFGEYDIEEKDLPAELQTMYQESWQECPYGVFCYLAQYKGENGIALIAEYHEFTPEGETSEINNAEQGEKVAKLLSERFNYPVIIAKQLGFPGTSPIEGDNDLATEVTLFIKAGASKKQVDEAAKYFGEIAYL